MNNSNRRLNQNVEVQRSDATALDFFLNPERTGSLNMAVLQKLFIKIQNVMMNQVILKASLWLSFFLSIHHGVFSQPSIPQTFAENSAFAKAASESLQQQQVNNSGTANVQLPIYTLECGDIKLPISINYNTGGIRVAQRPTIVGLGWNLQAGGIISRKIKGRIDEYTHIILFRDNDLRDERTYGAPYDVSYIGNYSKLNRTDWSSTFPEVIRTTNGYAFSKTANDFDITKDVSIDLAPDEFQFNVNGLTGSFFLNDQGKWVVKSDRQVDVQVEYGSPYIPHPQGTRAWQVPRAITKITLIDEVATKYFFEAVEYSRSPIEYYTTSYFDERNLSNETVPTAWLLTRIQSPTNDEIKITYKPHYELNTRKEPSNYRWNGALWGTKGDYITKNLVYTHLIDKITASNGAKIEFITSVSSQLDNQVNIYEDEIINPCQYRIGSTSDKQVCLKNHQDIGPNDKAILYQLDKVIVNYNEEIIKTYKFQYTNSLSQRLKLLSVGQEDKSGGVYDKVQFSYNDHIFLPAYNSGQEDLYGFYNGQYYFSQHPMTVSTTYPELVSNYLPTRQPNSELMKAESLKKIIYPTGGSIEYEYEPHDYSSKISPWEHNLVPVSGNPIGGGLRIRKIITRDNLTNWFNETHFIYRKGYAENAQSLISSGTLYDDINEQILNYSGSPANWNCSHFVLSKRKGGETPITYSEIAKVQTNNGFSIDAYLNYDNGVLDQPPFSITNGNMMAASYAYDNREVARGKLKSSAIYDNNRKPVQKVIYKYLHEQVSDFKTLPYVKSLQYGKWEQSVGEDLITYVAYPQYHFNNYVTSKESVAYDYSSGEQKQLTQVENFVYNQLPYDKLLNKVEQIDSKGNAYQTQFKYSFDFATGSSTDVFTVMKSKNIFSPAVEMVKAVVSNSNGAVTEISKEYINFNTWNYSLTPFIKAKTLNKAFGGEVLDLNNPSQLNATYDVYDTKGNLQQLTLANSGRESYQWGYNQELLTAKVTNASNSFVKAFEAATISTMVNAASSLPTTFTTELAGDIKLEFLTSAPNVNASFEVVGDLIGPNNTVYYFRLCRGNCTFLNHEKYPEWGSYTVGNSQTFPNMPAGTYTIKLKRWVTNAPVRCFCGTPDVYINTTYNGKKSFETPGIKEFFYQSFEEEPNSTQGNAFAGERYSLGDYTVPYIKPNTREYWIDYRSLEGGIWKYNKKEYFNNLVLSEGDAIDEVRVYPKNSLVTTYTYKPLIGKSSENDANGKTVFYEYDDLNRLIRIRDENKNIVKQIEFQNLVSNNASPDIQPVQEFQCKPCNVSGYSSNIQQQKYIDINPNSLTYKKEEWRDIGTTFTCGQPVWQTILSTCLQNEFGENTGYQELLQENINPCYVGPATQTTTIYKLDVCSIPTCGTECRNAGESFKCVNGWCEEGILEIISCGYSEYTFSWVQVYRYLFTDGSYSDIYIRPVWSCQ